jgi:hypothetical protein
MQQHGTLWAWFLLISFFLLTSHPVGLPLPNLSSGTRRPAREADNLTIICEHILWIIWGPRGLTALLASTASYINSLISLNIFLSKKCVISAFVTSAVCWVSCVFRMMMCGNLFMVRQTGITPRFRAHFTACTAGFNTLLTFLKKKTVVRMYARSRGTRGTLASQCVCCPLFPARSTAQHSTAQHSSNSLL